MVLASVNIDLQLDLFLANDLQLRKLSALWSATIASIHLPLCRHGLRVMSGFPSINFLGTRLSSISCVCPRVRSRPTLIIRPISDSTYIAVIFYNRNVNCIVCKENKIHYRIIYASIKHSILHTHIHRRVEIAHGHAHNTPSEQDHTMCVSVEIPALAFHCSHKSEWSPRAEMAGGN